MWKYTRKHNDDMFTVDVEPEYTLQDALYKWRGTVLDINMPPKPEEPVPVPVPEPIPKPEPEPVPEPTITPAIRVSAVSHDGYFDVKANPWNPKWVKDEHDETIERLYKIISSGPKEKVKDRLMSELRDSFPQTPSSSKILSGTNGMRIIEEQRREAQNKANTGDKYWFTDQVNVD